MAPREKIGVTDDAAKAGKAPAPTRATKAGKTAAKPESKVGKASASKPESKAGKSPASQLTKPAEPLFFYGHTNPNGWLSQFYQSEFDHYGKTYVCNEQFFHYAKATLFRDFVGRNLTEPVNRGVDKDQVTGNAILQAPSPKEHQSLDKKVTPFTTLMRGVKVSLKRPLQLGLFRPIGHGEKSAISVLL
jgi:predicted NAD-dependent protein-ADP-ribosyltransferase YbiA (DUF1768 family)